MREAVHTEVGVRDPQSGRRLWLYLDIISVTRLGARIEGTTKPKAGLRGFTGRINDQSTKSEGMLCVSVGFGRRDLSSLCYYDDETGFLLRRLRSDRANTEHFMVCVDLASLESTLSIGKPVVIVRHRLRCADHRHGRLLLIPAVPGELIVRPDGAVQGVLIGPVESLTTLSDVDHLRIAVRQSQPDR